ncbi:hypothetical protein AXG93_2954s1030 [Marchantia polymorpha subsp. ruderalis]|uniref:Uncharacterized protein n=1 Tax=Marchantia polymorpha subsp. ruderalis TaxID=1480154 RepID=A0A176W482_MARPO|nr:hypothetical protein AXG93_2954s1030 [Marchantia polymorpha subsp. ruderalis]
MSKATQLRMIPLKLPQIGLRAFQPEMTVVKLDFLLWIWNWVCQDMVREWQKGRDQPTRGFRPHPERWNVSDWEQVRTSSLLASLDEDIKDLRLKNEALRGHLAIVRKLQKVVNKTRDEKFEDAKKKFAKQQAKLGDELDSEQTRNRILSEEFVRQTRLLEQCQLARQADEDLIRQLQSQCGELRAQRAEAEMQLVVVEDDRRREADRTREELVERVNHCLRGYTLWEVAAQEKITLRELLVTLQKAPSGQTSVVFLGMTSA